MIGGIALMLHQMVTAHTGTCSMGGMFRYEAFRTGEIMKINRQSIRVHLTYMKRTTNGKVTSEMPMNTDATFTFWKVVKDKRFFRNSEHGIITI
jgi:uncharacterized protein YkvS